MHPLIHSSPPSLTLLHRPPSGLNLSRAAEPRARKLRNGDLFSIPLSDRDWLTGNEVVDAPVGVGSRFRLKRLELATVRMDDGSAARLVARMGDLEQVRLTLCTLEVKSLFLCECLTRKHGFVVHAAAAA
jgi:hypothetical protein